MQDFVIYAHSELDLTKKLLDKEPRCSMPRWIGAAATGRPGWAEPRTWEGAISSRFSSIEGARIDIFCAAMMGRLDAVKSFLTLQPHLIDAKGPHGFTLHFHAQVGGKDAENVLDYLQSIKKIELKPNPFLKKPAEPGKPAK